MFFADMSGNPVSNELNYRLHVIHAFPSLKILDKHEITDAERQAASVLYHESKALTVAFLKRRPLWRNPPIQPIGHRSEITLAMRREIENYRTHSNAQQRAQSAPTASTGGGADGHGEARAPLATAVEILATTSRTLKDILTPPDQEAAGPPARVGPAGGRRRDFFSMKRFVTGQVYAPPPPRPRRPRASRAGQ